MSKSGRGRGPDVSIEVEVAPGEWKLMCVAMSAIDAVEPTETGTCRIIISGRAFNVKCSSGQQLLHAWRDA